MPDSLTLDDHNTLIDALSYESLPLVWYWRQGATRALEPLGITPVRAVLLEFISRGNNQPKNLAAQLGIVFQALSALLRDLEQEGLISRINDVGDKRRVSVTLTDKGQLLCQEIRVAWSGVSAHFFKQLDQADLAALLRIYRKAGKYHQPN